MTHEPRLRRYLRFWRRDVRADVDDELAFHHEQRVQEFMAAGASRESAEASAAARFGDVAHARAELMAIGERLGRRGDRASVAEGFVQDIRFAVRALRRSPGLAAACIVTIALGVGANGAMFTLADRLFLRPPAGIENPSELRRFYVHTTWGVGSVPAFQAQFSYQAFATLDSGLADRVTIAAFTRSDTLPFRIGTERGGASRRVHGSYVTGDYMSVLGVRPALGRFFAPDETVMGTPVLVAVISHRFWERQFDGDSTVLGRVIDVNRQRMTIIGVAPRGFDGTDLNATELWMPLPAFPAPTEGLWYTHWAGWRFLTLIGRVAPQTSDAWLSNAATTVVRRDVRQYTNVVRDTGATIVPGPILESLGPAITPPPSVAIAQRLVGVTGIVLLIACANVASLLLARAMTRRREIAVRLALGVSRRRLVMQLAIEGVVLAVVAGVAALLVSAWAGGALRALVMPETYWAEAPLDARVAAFTLLIAGAAGIAAGLVPALQASNPGLVDSLKSGARDGMSGAGRSRLRAGLLVAQVALSVVLLYGAGLFVRSLSNIHHVDLGVDQDQLVYATALTVSKDGPYLDHDCCERQNFLIPRLQEIATQLAERPDVENVALASHPPMSGYTMTGLYLADRRRVPDIDARGAAWFAVSASYFATTGRKLARGRFFNDSDRGSKVVVVNETAARTYWPNANALGQCLRVERDTMPCSTVVGVMKDARLRNIVEGATAQVVSLATPTRAGTLRDVEYLIVRVAPDRVGSIASLLRAELEKRFPPSASIIVRSMAEVLEPQIRPWRLGATIFVAFGVLALVVAALGTYSVIAYAVSQRAHEMSVRVALGARAADVVRLIVGQGVRLAGIGVVCGAGIAIVSSHFVAALLYETEARDPLVVVAVALLLTVVATIASGIPAWRAMRADPATALRTE